MSHMYPKSNKVCRNCYDFPIDTDMFFLIYLLYNSCHMFHNYRSTSFNYVYIQHAVLLHRIAGSSSVNTNNNNSEEDDDRNMTKFQESLFYYQD